MCLRMLLLLLVGFSAVPGGSWAQAGAGVATIVEGEIVLTRDSTRFAVAEGVRVRADDLHESAPQAKSRDEIGVLADSFSRMRKSLVHAMKMLDS